VALDQVQVLLACGWLVVMANEVGAPRQ